jgi:hypothetical protein
MLLLVCAAMFYTAANTAGHTHSIVCYFANCALLLATLMCAFYLMAASLFELEVHVDLLFGMFGSFLVQAPVMLLLLGAIFLMVEMILWFKITFDAGLSSNLCFGAFLMILPLFIHSMHKLAWVVEIVHKKAELDKDSAMLATLDDLQSRFSNYATSKGGNCLLLDRDEFLRVLGGPALQLTSVQHVIASKVFDLHVNAELEEIMQEAGASFQNGSTLQQRDIVQHAVREVQKSSSSVLRSRSGSLCTTPRQISDTLQSSDAHDSGDAKGTGPSSEDDHELAIPRERTRERGRRRKPQIVNSEATSASTIPRNREDNTVPVYVSHGSKPENPDQRSRRHHGRSASGSGSRSRSDNTGTELRHNDDDSPRIPGKSRRERHKGHRDGSRKREKHENEYENELRQEGANGRGRAVIEVENSNFESAGIDDCIDVEPDNRSRASGSTEPESQGKTIREPDNISPKSQGSQDGSKPTAKGRNMRVKDTPLRDDAHKLDNRTHQAPLQDASLKELYEQRTQKYASQRQMQDGNESPAESLDEQSIHLEVAEGMLHPSTPIKHHVHLLRM